MCQSAGRPAVNPLVVGSIPTPGANYISKLRRVTRRILRRSPVIFALLLARDDTRRASGKRVHEQDAGRLVV